MDNNLSKKLKALGAPDFLDFFGVFNYNKDVNKIFRLVLRIPLRGLFFLLRFIMISYS